MLLIGPVHALASLTITHTTWPYQYLIHMLDTTFMANSNLLVPAIHLVSVHCVVIRTYHPHTPTFHHPRTYPSKELVVLLHTISQILAI